LAIGHLLDDIWSSDKATYFKPEGRRISRGQRHKEDDACLGKPLCPDCYNYNAAVVWNAHGGELWRRTIITVRRRLAKLAKAHGVPAPRRSYAMVAEFQRRGLIHFHAIFRPDGTDPARPERTTTPPPAFTAAVLAEVSGPWQAPYGSPPSRPAKPKGWDIAWGAQVDPRVVKLTDDGEVTDVAVAAYLAKYATKSTE
jgi:hypothetical protein